MGRIIVLLVSVILAAPACEADGGAPGAASSAAGPTTPSAAAAGAATTQSGPASTQSGAASQAEGDTVALPTLTTTPAGVVPAGVCEDQSPASTVEFGPMGTFLRVAGDEYLEGVIQARPDVACPGDLVEFTVTVVNRSDAPLRYSTTEGLLLHTDGPEKWSLAPVPAVEIPPGALWTTTVSATIPPSRAGDFTLSAGYGVSGPMRVLDAMTARDP